MGIVKKVLGKGPIEIKCALTTLVLSALSLYASAQSGNDGIDAANTEVRKYFDSGTNLMYAVGALLGLIGAVKVYQKWNAGDPDTSKVAAAWFGSCVFLVIVVTVIRVGIIPYVATSFAERGLILRPKMISRFR